MIWLFQNRGEPRKGATMKMRYLFYLSCIFVFCACSAENESTLNRTASTSENENAPSSENENVPANEGNENISGNTGGTLNPATPGNSNGSQPPSWSTDDPTDDKVVTTVTQDDGTTVDVVNIDDCPGPLQPDVVALLENGGSVDPSMKWLYPYDQTVFPGGIVPPTLQWQPQASGTEAIMLKMTSERFSYRGCFGPADPARLMIPPNVWDEAYRNQAPLDNLTVELTTVAGGVVSGPITQVWRFARGKLRGDVYYSTYDSILVNGGDPLASNGAVLRIRPDQTQPEIFLSAPGVYPFGPCISCHSLSARGGTMLAELHTYPAIANVGLFASSSYNLEVNPNPQPPPNPGILDEAAFGALYPDGSRYMSNGSPTDSTTGGQVFFPYGDYNVYAMLGPRESRLFDTVSGAQLQADGWDGVINYAKMPMFSPDGKKIVFNHHEDSTGHSLAVMDFDESTNSFSNLEIIFKDDTLYPGWPFFTPDSKYVIFALGNDNHYASGELGIFGETIAVFRSDLYIVDINNKNVFQLKQAGGFNDDGSSYMLNGQRDEHLDFYPTVAPISSGGYFWMYFTSRRVYGNYSNTMDLLDRKTKKIWVSALDIPLDEGEFKGLTRDPSHPAFVLPGQEMESGNMRAFPTLEPCKPEGATCEVGLDCCKGFCTNGICGPPPPEKKCSELEEACETDADCCDPDQICIGGFCSVIIVIE